MRPGPPPEITEKPASDSRRAIVFGLLVVSDDPALMRALPNMLTAGRMPRRRSVASGELCHNPQHPPGLLPVGRVERLRVDQLRNLAGLRHACLRSFSWMGRRTCTARSTRCRICARRAASRPARCAGCCRCCAEWSRTASRTTSPSCSTRRARRSATTGIRSTRRNRPPMPDDLVAADRAAARARPRARLAAADDRRRRGRRRHRHAGAPARRRQASTRVISTVATRTSRSSSRRQSRWSTR